MKERAEAEDVEKRKRKSKGKIKRDKKGNGKGVGKKNQVMKLIFFFNDTATTGIYTLHIVGSVRCV